MTGSNGRIGEILDHALAIHHAELARRRKPNSWLRRTLGFFALRAQLNWMRIAALPLQPPIDILRGYDIPAEAFEKAGTPVKYRIRAYNLSRDFLRLHDFVPELLDAEAPRRDILELSPGACAMHELLAPLGHRIRLAEYYHDERNTYGPFHARLDVRPAFFDGRQRPFPFEDQTADYVFCLQAIEAYTSDMNDYPAILGELKRLTRHKLVVIFNGHYPRAHVAIRRLKAWIGTGPNHRWSYCYDTQLAALIWTRPGSAAAPES